MKISTSQTKMLSGHIRTNARITKPPFSRISSAIRFTSGETVTNIQPKSTDGTN